MNNNYNEAEMTTRQRGRPRKAPQVFKFSSYVYNTPLGCQYSQPMIITMNYSRMPNAHPLKIFNSGAEHQRKMPTNMQPEINPTAAIAMRREKRAAAVKLISHKKKKRHGSEDSFSSSSTVSEDSNYEANPYEKLLDYDEETDKFLVKFRNKSYIHCDWVPKEEIKSTRIGAMKAKRYKKIGINDEYTKIDRIIHETYENDQKIVLVKWMGLQDYENCTFELESVVQSCENYEKELKGI